MPEEQKKDTLQAATERFERNNKAVEHAKLSAHIYNPDEPEPEGWKDISNDPEKLKQFGLKPKDLYDPESNFRAGVYIPDPDVFGDDMQPVVAFKGTDFSSGEDLKNNFTQALGFHSDYYEKAVKIGRKIKKSEAIAYITGHSLGGGEASAAAQVSGMPASTFNAADLHSNTAKRYSEIVLPAAIKAFRIKGDILTGLQEAGWGGTAAAASLGFALGGAKGAAIGALARLGFSALLPNAAGTPYELEGKGNPINRHGIQQVIDSLEEGKDNDQETIAAATGKYCS